MRPFTTLTATAAPLMMQNVDTDVLIRIERCVGTARTPLRSYGFESLRYRPDGSDEPGFLLNQPPYDRAEILLAGNNFGCGSSREHAVWALSDMGFRCVVAPSYGDVFYNNCFQNGMLPVTLPIEVVETLAAEVSADPTRRLLTVDLTENRIVAPSGDIHPFQLDPMRREGLLYGLDDVGLTLRREAEIAAFQARDRRDRGWAYAGIAGGLNLKKT
jgi:3-isopropylmalate/(R)-2-methylmalate dehydratase small subunit